MSAGGGAGCRGHCVLKQKWTVLALAGLGLSGCATSLPRDAISDMPTATVTFSKGYIGQTALGKSANTIYEYFADADCKTGARVPLTALTGNSRTDLIPATRKLFFSGNANFYYASGYSKSCTGYVGFTPRAGARYSVVVKTAERACTFVVRDIDTERPPPDIEFFNNASACGAFMRRRPQPPRLVPRPPIAPPTPLADPAKT